LKRYVTGISNISQNLSWKNQP